MIPLCTSTAFDPKGRQQPSAQLFQIFIDTFSTLTLIWISHSFLKKFQHLHRWPNLLQEYGPSDGLGCFHLQQALGDGRNAMTRKVIACRIGRELPPAVHTHIYHSLSYLHFRKKKIFWSLFAEMEELHGGPSIPSHPIPSLLWLTAGATAFLRPCTDRALAISREVTWKKGRVRRGRKKKVPFLSAIFPLCVAPGHSEQCAPTTPGEDPAHMQGADAVSTWDVQHPGIPVPLQRAAMQQSPTGAVCHAVLLGSLPWAASPVHLQPHAQGNLRKVLRSKLIYIYKLNVAVINWSTVP